MKNPVPQKSSCLTVGQSLATISRLPASVAKGLQAHFWRPSFADKAATRSFPGRLFVSTICSGRRKLEKRSEKKKNLASLPESFFFIRGRRGFSKARVTRHGIKSCLKSTFALIRKKTPIACIFSSLQ